MKTDRPATFGRLLCLCGAAIGLLGLVAWIGGLHHLSSILPGQPPMQPNTALCLLLLGLAGALRARPEVSRIQQAVSIAAAVVVLSIAAGTLWEYALRVSLPIDTFLQHVFVGRELSGSYPGRPSPPTAFALALLSAAILVFDSCMRARARPSEWLVICAMLTAFTALIGFAYGAGPLYRLAGAPVTGVALPTAVSLLVIATGLLFERPDGGVMRVVLSRRPGGIMLRRLVLPVLLAASLMGPAVMRLLVSLGVIDFPLLAATLTMAMASVSVLLLASTARALNRAHEAVELGRSRMRELLQFAPEGIFIADLDARLVDVNDAACRLLKLGREEILGKTVFDFIPPGESGRLAEEREDMLKGRVVVSEWPLRQPDGSYLPTEVSASILADGRWQGFARDISERKQAEEQLRQSRERLDLTLRGADLAAWDWNVRTGEVTFNRRWAEMRGFRPEDIEPHVSSWLRGIHPEDLPRVERVLQEHLEGKTNEYEAELRVRTRSGEWLWILDRGKVFARDEHGQPMRMAGTELDITNQKRLEEQLRLSLAQASGILAISADAIISVDESQRVTMFNQGAEKIFGCTKTEAIGGPLERWIPERFRAAHRQHVEGFARGAAVARHMGERNMPVFALRKDGSEFPADAAISKLDVGGLKLLTIALRDVTDQRRIEREERLLAAVTSILASSLDYDETLTNIAQATVKELADVCILETMEEPGRTLRIEVGHRDPAKAEAAEVLRRHPLGIRLATNRPSAPNAQEPLVIGSVDIEHLQAIAATEQHLRALQDVDPASLIALPLMEHKRILGTMVLLSTKGSPRLDSNSLPLAKEVARRAAAALENALLYKTALRATQARDDVLGIVAHDLRNPLSVVTLEAAVLRRHAGECASGSLASAEIIGRAADRMSRLIDDLLDLGLIETGHLSLDLACVPVSQLIKDCLEHQKILAAAASIEITVDVESDLPDVRADHHRLLQVLENLIGNAIKFTGAAGRITLGAARDDDEVRFWVANSGADIPAEHLPHLFDRFWQARQKRRGGAGLGLAIVKGIVEAHGGRVWAQSKPGCGSTFAFTIPIAGASSDSVTRVLAQSGTKQPTTTASTPACR